MAQIVYEIARTLAWSLVGAVSMSFALAILIRTFDWCTPGIEEMGRKKGNVAVAIVLAAVVLAFAFVIGMILRSPYS